MSISILKITTKEAVSLLLRDAVRMVLTLTNTFKFKYEELNTESDFSCRQMNHKTLYALQFIHL